MADDTAGEGAGRRWVPSRRKLLAGAVGAGLAAAGLAALQPRRRTLPSFQGDGEPRPRRPARPLRVAVVGGGLAGLAAATTLAERGVQVTLLERAPQLGGKVAGWTVELLGRTFAVEHGFHGFFRQYANLDRLLEPTGALAHLAPVEGYPIWFGDRPPEHFGEAPPLFPVNLMAVVARSRSVRFRDFAAYDPGLLELLRYHPEHTYAALDTVDFASFCARDVRQQGMVETVLMPFAETTLNHPERLSAAEAIRFFHAYFIGNPDGLGFRVATRDTATGVVDPLRARLEALGGVVRTGATVVRVLGDEAGVTGVVVAGGAAGGAEPWVVPTGQVPVDGRWAAVDAPGGGKVFLRRDGAGYRALDGRCTHKGCGVVLAASGFHCPCHDGRYDADGAVVSGPPPRPLDALRVEAGEGGLTILGAVVDDEVLEVDHVVLAAESMAAAALLDASKLPLPELDAWRARVGPADPYVVWRLWVDRPVRPDAAPFTTVSRAGDLDALAVYSAFQDEAKAWAAETGGSVLEAHAYAVPPERRVSDEAMKQGLWSEVQRVLPELQGANILADVFMQQQDFTRFAPGDQALRPRTRTSIPNLHLAGDWIRIDAPVFLMEAAVTSGMLAANAVFAAEGLEEEPIVTVDRTGPFAG